MWVPMRAGNFSREKALYGAIIVVWATCHAEPSLVTTVARHRDGVQKWVGGWVGWLDGGEWGEKETINIY